MMTAPASGLDTRPWYRQFWPWVLIGIPLTSVILGVLMVYLAISTQDGLVRDYFRKDGRTIEADRSRDELALRQGISARIMVDDMTGSVRLELIGISGTQPDRLKLELIHPTQQREDAEIALHRLRAGQYMGAFEQVQNGRRQLQLLPPDESWRIGNEQVWFPLRDAAELKSRLAP